MREKNGRRKDGIFAMACYFPITRTVRTPADKTGPSSTSMKLATLIHDVMTDATRFLDWEASGPIYGSIMQV